MEEVQCWTEGKYKKVKIYRKLGVKILTCQANTTFKITPIIKYSRKNALLYSGTQ